MKISEVSKECNVSIDTLRYYERIGLLPQVSRNNGGIRDYSDVDVKRVAFIKCMRHAGLSIEMLLEYFALLQQGDETQEARREILTEQRNLLAGRIAELQETLALLDGKIEALDQELVETEASLALQETSR